MEATYTVAEWFAVSKKKNKIPPEEEVKQEKEEGDGEKSFAIAIPTLFGHLFSCCDGYAYFDHIVAHFYATTFTYWSVE